MTIPALNKLKSFYKLKTQKKIILDDSIVGLRLKPFFVEITNRQISNFAAAVGDENKYYYLTRNNKILCTHPVFPVRISWQILKNISEWTDTDIPFDLKTQLVHQEEHLAFERLLQTDDKLTLHGQIAALLPHKRGAKLVLKFVYKDQHDHLVLTEHISAVLFNIRCADQGRQLDLPLPTGRVSEETIIWEEQIPVSRTAPFIYDGCTDIVYPVHTDQTFATRMGLPDIILQGTATLAMSSTVLIKKELNENPNKIRLLTGKFTDIVVPPNRLTVRLLKKDGTDLYFDVLEQSGRPVLRGGHLKIKA